MKIIKESLIVVSFLWVFGLNQLKANLIEPKKEYPAIKEYLTITIPKGIRSYRIISSSGMFLEVYKKDKELIDKGPLIEYDNSRFIDEETIIEIKNVYYRRHSQPAHVDVELYN